MEKMSSGFPSDVLRLLCLPEVFYLVKLSPNNYPLLQLQLQLQSAGSLHVAFRNITELRQSSRRTSERKPEDIFSIKYDPIYLNYCFEQLINIHRLVFQRRGLLSKLHSVSLNLLLTLALPLYS